MAFPEGCIVESVDLLPTRRRIVIEKRLKLPEQILDVVSSILSDGCSSNGVPIMRRTGYVKVSIAHELEEGEREDDQICARALNRAVNNKIVECGSRTRAAEVNCVVINTARDMLTSDNRAMVCAWAIGFCYPLLFLDMISNEDKDKLVNEVYDLNSDIEDQIIAHYSGVRGNFEQVVSSS